MKLLLSTKSKADCTIYLNFSETKKPDLPMEKWELAQFKATAEDKRSMMQSYSEKNKNIFVFAKNEVEAKTKETFRRRGAQAIKEISLMKFKSVNIINQTENPALGLAFAEGLFLSNYQFLKYKTKGEKSDLITIEITDNKLKQADLTAMQHVLDGNVITKDLVNEPLSFLTAVQLSKEMAKQGKAAKFSVKTLDKKEITKLGMGGLLAVNRGSQDPPTFNIMEYKPSGASNKKPIILVGKGVVYDTGGLSLKPTANSMDLMKSDMAGAGAVVGAMYAIAKMKLNLHVIGIVPATDNRPGENAIVPGDVITHFSGKTSEILNTDAEGRMILADALSYASKYGPELVIDLATLTGAAAAAIGPLGAAMVGTASEEVKNALKLAGENTYERIAEFPFWEEYGDLIKSEIADIKNIGGPFGGVITAGKYLEHFTDYPWIHLDIAGPAFLTTADTYRGKGGSGYGVRLLVEFLRNYKSKK
jgi:leucyl aminopeptidase